MVPVSYLAILSQFRDSIKQLFIFLYKSTSKMSPFGDINIMNCIYFTTQAS
ncbi:hypothetical protein PROVRETT_09337 [Providencia rettgeri DSM 1131]|nr:hypothetical protein PROVRETT_09337 [Providencia rettgeri DSM 1131]